ncbi:MAG: hypothetical protein ACT6QX_21070, partial [Sphingopyxis sp.]|uniref:hypothetical protein n=1 Tax=Sphingopyxis sp. TaxID=1908224 RepID=UPI0040377C0A
DDGGANNSIKGSSIATAREGSVLLIRKIRTGIFDPSSKSGEFPKKVVRIPFGLPKPGNKLPNRRQQECAAPTAAFGVRTSS